MKPLIPPAIFKIVSLFFSFKDGFGIEYCTKVDMQISKEKKPTKNSIVRGSFNKFPDFFVQAFKIVVDS